jgi:nitrite reductase/ring-hydroxylating ferredoxin subunit
VWILAPYGGMSTPLEFDTGLVEADLDPERPRAIETPWGTMGIYTISSEGGSSEGGRELLCSQAFCPHLAGPLFQGTLSGATVTCPWHRWRFDLRTGERLHPPREEAPDGCSIERCEVTWSERRTVVLRRR